MSNLNRVDSIRVMNRRRQRTFIRAMKRRTLRESERLNHMRGDMKSIRVQDIFRFVGRAYDSMLRSEVLFAFPSSLFIFSLQR